MRHLEMDEAAYRSLAHTAGQLEFFSSFKGAELDAILSHIQHYGYEGGETVFKKGSTADALYIIHEGQIVIRLNRWFALIRKTACLGPGNLFGEMALLAGRRRSATAVARGPAKLFILLRGDFEDLLRRNPTFASGVRWLAEQRGFEDSH